MVVAIRYIERFAEDGAVASVGSRGDSYDNSMAEAFNSLFKGELVHTDGPWKGLADVEYAALNTSTGSGHRRLHGELGMNPARRIRNPLLQSEPVSCGGRRQRTRP